MDLNELTIAIQKLFIHHLSTGDITIIEAASAMYILSMARDEKELRHYLDNLSTKITFIHDLFDHENQDLHQNLEKIVQNFIQKIIFDNPTLAAEISQKAMNKEMTVQKLSEFYPEFQKYLQQNIQS